MDASLAPGSELWKFNEVIECVREQKLMDGGLDIESLMNITLVHREGNVVIHCHLESFPLKSFDLVSKTLYFEFNISSIGVHLRICNSLRLISICSNL